MTEGQYFGCQTQTRLGKTCQVWSSQSPHKHDLLVQENHNYCRNPGREPYIWCFTTDPAFRFDICDPVGKLAAMMAILLLMEGTGYYSS